MKKVALFLLIFNISLNAIELSDSEKTYLHHKSVIKMCVDPDWEPFEVIDKNGQHKGISADIINLISERLNIKIELVKTSNWDESIEYSKHRKCDILSFLNQTPKREEWLIFTEPIFKDPNVLVGRIDTKYIDDISKIKASMALPTGTAMEEFFKRDFPNITIIPVSSENEAFKLIEDKKVDLTLRSLIVAAHTIKKDGLFNLKIVGEIKGYENKLRIGVLKNEVILRDILNKGVATLSEDDIDKIVNKHVTIVIEKVTNFTIGVYIFLALFSTLLVVFIWNYMLRKRVAYEVQKNIEQQKILFEKVKQAELVELIANISHQWRDGLYAISSVNMEIMTKLDYDIKIDEDELRAYTKEIEQGIKFMSDTMRSFLDFYKVSNELREFSISDSITEIIKIMDRNIKYNKLQLEINKEEDIKIVAIKNEWMNVWLNIINNVINIAKKRAIINPKLVVNIKKDEIIFGDNCGGCDNLTLKSLNEFNQNGLGLKMCRDILKKSNWYLNIINGQNGLNLIIRREK